MKNIVLFLALVLSFFVSLSLSAQELLASNAGDSLSVDGSKSQEITLGFLLYNFISANDVMFLKYSIKEHRGNFMLGNEIHSTGLPDDGIFLCVTHDFRGLSVYCSKNRKLYKDLKNEINDRLDFLELSESEWENGGTVIHFKSKEIDPQNHQYINLFLVEKEQYIQISFSQD